MTIHTAKGLEFKVVFVIGLNDGVFPSSNSLFNDNNLEEERRVAYVAITRSKERLYLSCNKGFSFQLNRELTKSRFLNDIGLENLKFINIEGKSSSSLNLN
jgi:DNA helicase-2/ATP-dependent DNA helicase PcrA